MNNNENMMEYTFGGTAVEGGYLNISLHNTLVARIYVPPPFWEDKYRDSVNENDDYFSDDKGNTYSIQIWSAMGDISYSIEADDIVDKVYYKDFEKNVIVDFEEIIPEEFNHLEEEYEIFTEEEKSRFYMSFINGLNINKELNKRNIDIVVQEEVYRRMIFINLITLVEVYFGDVFRLSIAKNPDYLKLAIEKVKELSSEKISLKDLLEKQYTPLSYTEQIISSKILFHKLEKVNELYKAIFGEKIIDENSTEVLSYIQIRHDLVHRNRTAKDSITQTYIDMVIENLENYISNIDEKLYDKIVNV
jgi:hypothetical protein